MSGNNIWQIMTLIILVGLSAFFSISETSLTSINKLRLRHLVESHVKKADKIERLLENPNKLLSALLIGNNVVTIVASTMATVLFVDLFGNPGVGIAAGVMTFSILVFAEITPKTLASENPEPIAFGIVNAVSFLVFILTPLIVIFKFITGFLIRLLGRNKNNSPSITTSELKTMVNIGHQEGVLEEEEKNMIHNVFAFGGAKVKDIMTPRTEIVAIDQNATHKEIMAVFKREQFSRIPVYRESLDHIVGMLYLKDMAFVPDNSQFDIHKVMRKPLFIYEQENIDELFDQMRIQKIQLAIVLDEYGGTDGLVSIEDLVEEIVGEIFDEYDEGDEEIQMLGTDEFLVDGKTNLPDINEALGVHLKSNQFASISGYVVGFLRRFPQAGETVIIDNLKIIIESTDRNKIKKMRIFKMPSISKKD